MQGNKIDVQKMVDGGRNIALQLLEQIALASSDSDSLRFNMAMLQVAASHILASLMFNQLKEKPGPIEPLLEKVTWGAKQELEFMIEAEKSGHMVMRPLTGMENPQ